MKNSHIENTLREYFDTMINRYKWLKIKFEYNEKRGVHLVSYSPKEKIAEDENFLKDSMAFEDKINLQYEDNAPLFCDDEKYFKLSSNAETIKHVSKKIRSFNLEC